MNQMTLIKKKIQKKDTSSQACDFEADSLVTTWEIYNLYAGDDGIGEPFLITCSEENMFYFVEMKCEVKN